MQAPLVAATTPDREHEFRFLNVAKAFSRGKVDWMSTNMTRLWRYNLHYFDYILDMGRSIETLSDLISDWIKGNPMGAGDGWESLPLSRRLSLRSAAFARSHTGREKAPNTKQFQ